MMECQNTATAKIKVYDVNGVNADEFWLLNIYMYVVFGIWRILWDTTGEGKKKNNNKKKQRKQEIKLYVI